MARSGGTSTASSTPAAVRATTPGWRDPRLWLGVVIVAVSVVAGARILSSADETVAIWSVTDDMGVGDEVTETDLVAQRVRFADETTLENYYTVDQTLPADVRLTQGLGRGNLLPRSAVGSLADADTLQVPLAVDAEQVPPSVGAGSVIDVYLVAATSSADPATPAATPAASPAASPSAGSPTAAPGDSTSAGQPPTPPGPALSAVTVLDAPSLAQAFGPTGKRQLVLSVPEEAAQRFFAQLGASENAVITVVRRG